MGQITQRENEWQDRASAAAIAAARRLVLGDTAVIPANSPIGRLGEVEWGWIIAAVIFAWIGVRAEQATSEGLDVETAIRAGLDPDPWDAGAIAAILPQLAGALVVDWSQPLRDWPRETMIQFLDTALGLVQQALSARDHGNAGITRAKPTLAILD
jgi:hypothetical protein